LTSDFGRRRVTPRFVDRMSSVRIDRAQSQSAGSYSPLDLRKDYGDRILRAGIVRRSGVSEFFADSYNVRINSDRGGRLRDRSPDVSSHDLELHEEVVGLVRAEAVMSTSLLARCYRIDGWL
jgi:hypothetical protein